MPLWMSEPVDPRAAHIGAIAPGALTQLPTSLSGNNPTRFLIGPPIFIEGFLYVWYCPYPFTFSYHSI